MLSSDPQSSYLRESLAFLDGQTLLVPSLNEQIGFDFQGLRKSFRDDSTHPDAASVARYGRIWIYDVALSIYADLKAGRLRQAGYQAGRVMQLALRERQRGYQGLWHFSYNTTGDSFIDPRGPTGANAWCLNALYAYTLARQDRSLLTWLNQRVEGYLFPLQVMQPQDPRLGLIRAGLHTSEDVARGSAMGYRVYEGELNHPYEHVILEHCADVACTFRLAHRATRAMDPSQERFLKALVHRHDLLMQAIRRRFWQGDHFVSALEASAEPCTGTDGMPSIAVDNNTWAAHLWIPYEVDLVQQSAAYVRDHFLIHRPPARIEDALTQPLQESLSGLYYFPATFVDPFVQVPAEYRGRMQELFHPEAAFGFVLLLWALAQAVSDPEKRQRYRHQAQELYEKTVAVQRLYGPSAAPYASANVPQVFSTLHSVATAATGVITTAILNGAAGDDFLGAVPPPEFTVAGKPPQSTRA